jgi:hypothetical protein
MATNNQKIARDEYCNPKSHAAYSFEFFKMVTFQHASELVYPTIAQKSSLVSFAFEPDVLYSAPANLILPGEIIPHVDDLSTVINSIPDAFDEGMRTVTLALKFNGEEVIRTYHFAKVSCFFSQTSQSRSFQTDQAVH